jgi:hypothetical protein
MIVRKPPAVARTFCPGRLALTEEPTMPARDSSLQELRMLVKKKHRSPIRTLEGWAIGVLLEAGPIRECEEHGWMRDRADPHARERAFDVARQDPPTGLSRQAAAVVIADALNSIGGGNAGLATNGDGLAIAGPNEFKRLMRDCLKTPRLPHLQLNVADVTAVLTRLKLYLFWTNTSVAL